MIVSSDYITSPKKFETRLLSAVVGSIVVVAVLTSLCFKSRTDKHASWTYALQIRRGH